MRCAALRIVRIVAGVALVILGIVGLVLPLLQGILFIVLGLGLLSVDIQPVRRLRGHVARWIRGKRKDRRATTRRPDSPGGEGPD